MPSAEVETYAALPAPVDIPFTPGDAVRIVSGPFEGTPAVFIEHACDLMSIRLQLTVFGRSAVVDVPIANVEVPAR